MFRRRGDRANDDSIEESAQSDIEASSSVNS